MRISDWSSDVCSSDLTSCAGTANEVKTTIAYGASGVANNLLPTQVTKAAGNGSGSATVKTAYDTIGDAISVDGRSEEHTSELQSLMRISYAVFCLKKKKHNNTGNTLIISVSLHKQKTNQ